MKIAMRFEWQKICSNFLIFISLKGLGSYAPNFLKRVINDVCRISGRINLFHTIYSLNPHIISFLFMVSDKMHTFSFLFNMHEYSPAFGN